MTLKYLYRARFTDERSQWQIRVPDQTNDDDNKHGWRQTIKHNRHISLFIIPPGSTKKRIECNNVISRYISTDSRLGRFTTSIGFKTAFIYIFDKTKVVTALIGSVSIVGHILG